MATYKILYWQEIPSQIKAEDERDDVTLSLDPRFMERIDQLAAQRGLQGADDYLAQWHWSEDAGARGRRPGGRRGPQARARGRGRLVEQAFGHAGHPHHQRPPHEAAGRSLFDAAEQAGVRVPTSCVKQGKCRECIVEVTQGWRCSRRPPSRTASRRGRFRLSCQCRDRGRRGESTATLCAAATCASSGMRSISRHASPTALDPAVTRDGDRILMLDGVEIARSTGADSRPGDRPRHDHGRPPADQPRNGRTGRRLLVREPAALRRLGRDVAHPLRHGASGQAADADAGRLSDSRDRGIPRRSHDHLRSGRRRQLDDA